MTRTELVKKVAMKMDELSSSDEMNLNIGIEDNNPLIILINGLLDEAVNETLVAIPQHRCTYIKRLLSSIDEQKINFSLLDKDSRKVLKVLFPKDFLRFVRLTSSYLSRDVLSLHGASEAIAIRQNNPHLMAGSAKPVAVMDNGVDGHPCAKVYSYPSDAVLDKSQMATAFYYVPRVDGLTEDYIPSLDNYITDIAAWVCASKTFATQGDTQRSATCMQNAQSLMV
jgi:hypothetical protein